MATADGPHAGEVGVGPEEIQVVEEFLGALERLDVDRAVELLDPDIEYQNVPFPPAKGRRAVEQQLRGLARYASGFEVVHHNIAANGHVVLTERTDIITVGRWRSAFWVCGTCEGRDGRVSLWRDRFDYADLTWAMLRGAIAALLPGRR